MELSFKLRPKDRKELVQRSGGAKWEASQGRGPVYAGPSGRKELGFLQEQRGAICRSMVLMGMGTSHKTR